MPRPSKITEQERIRAWVITHPRGIVPPDKPPLSDAAKLTRGVLGSGAVAIFFASVYEYFSLAGVVDSMSAARVVLIFAWVIGFVGVLVSELVWGKSRKTIMRTAIGTALILTVGLWSLDSWTVRYRIAHAPPGASSPQTPTQKAPEIPPSLGTGTVGIGVMSDKNGRAATLDHVVIDGVGSTGIQNHSGQLNLKDSSISHERIGIDNQNPDAQINLERSQVSDGEVGILMRGPSKPTKKKKP